MNPNDDENVKMALKGLYNKSPKRQRQAKALGWHEIKRFLITAGDNIRAHRERALIAVAYDTMARRSEVVAMDVEDFTFMEDGSGRVIIRRSKTDQEGEGSLAYLSPDTVEYLQAWLNVSRISSGAVFRRLIGRGRIVDQRTAPPQLAPHRPRRPRMKGWWARSDSNRGPRDSLDPAVSGGSGLSLHPQRSKHRGCGTL